MKTKIVVLGLAMALGMILYFQLNKPPTHNEADGMYDEDSKYEEKHKDTDWFREMSEPNADYFKVKEEYEKYFGNHRWEKSRPRQLGESWLKTNIYYLDKNGKVQDRPPFDASRHTATNSVMMGSTTSVGTWDMLGPVNSFGSTYGSPYNHGGYIYLNRFDPTNTSKIFASFVTGGLWMTTNDGVDWTLTDANMPDDFYLDIDVCISTPTVVYAITKTRVIKSIDGGLTYSNTGLTSATHSGIGYDIAVSPTNPNIVIARWNDKIYRTSDGGVTWSTITSGLPNHVIFDSGIISEMVDWSTTDNNVVYFLSTSHNDQVTVHRSGDSGATFSTIQTITLVPPANGLVVGWTKLLLPSNNATHIYVAVGSGASQNGHHAVHLYKLDNTTGAIISSRINMIDGIGSNELHHGDIAMDRNDENKIVLGGYSQKTLHYSSDNGATFTYDAVQRTHADLRSMDMNSNKVAIGSDGELAISSDGGATCTSISNSISNHELWGFGSAFKSDLIAVGCNHGPVMIKETHNGFDWYNGAGADQQNTDVNPLDDRYIHTRGYTQDRIFRTGPHTLIIESNLLDIGGLTYFNNVAFHPNLYNTMITHHAGGFPSGNPNLETWKNSLVRTDDQGNTLNVVKTFTDQVFREKICMTNPNAIYVVVGLSNNKLWKTLDGGTTWTDVTPSLAESVFETHISDVAVSDVDPNEVWLTYSSVQTSCKILKSTDGGVTWPNNLTGSVLSSYPTERIVHQRGSNGGVYTANKDGVYYRNNTMSDWSLLGTGLPLMDIRWIFINYNLGKLRIGTSRGAWEHNLFETSPPKAQISAGTQTVDCPNTQQVQFRDYSTVRNATATWSWSFPGGTPSTSTDENPLISYSGTPDGLYDVSLTVIDEFGTDSQTLSQFIHVNGTNSGCVVDTIPGKMMTLTVPGDYAQANGGLNISSNTITLSCWIKPNGVQSGNAGLIFSGNNGATGMSYNGSSLLGYTWRDEPGSYNFNSGLNIPTDVWSHVALVVTPNSATLYLNGIGATRSATHAAVDFNGAFQFGIDRSNTARNFKGDMDEICIYNRALTTAEIRELMNLTRNNSNAGSLPSSDPNLISYYQINESSEKPIFDKIGGKHAALVGGALRTISSAPVGGGTFQRMNIVSGGIKDFSTPGVSMTFPPVGTFPNGDVVVTRLNVPSDQLAAPSVLPNAPVSYYVVRNYGTNATFDALLEMKFSKVQGTNLDMVTSPNGLKLYKRGSNAFGMTWGSSIDDADIVTDASGTGTVAFNTGLSINSFSQFSIENKSDKKLAISGVRLQGAMPASGTTMNTLINALIPLTDPYGLGITASSVPSNAVDWVKVELRTGASPGLASTIIASTAGFLLNNGIIKGIDGGDLKFNAAPDGSYFVSISHRNHLKVITNATVSLMAGTGTLDISTAAIYNDAAITSNTPTTTVNGVVALWGGDANGNGKVSYNGGTNDRESILLQLGFNLSGEDLTYRKEDVNLNAKTTYNGGTNDRETILLYLGFNVNAELNQHHP